MTKLQFDLLGELIERFDRFGHDVQEGDLISPLMLKKFGAPNDRTVNAALLQLLLGGLVRLRSANGRGVGSSPWSRFWSPSEAGRKRYSEGFSAAP